MTEEPSLGSLESDPFSPYDPMEKFEPPTNEISDSDSRPSVSNSYVSLTSKAPDSRPHVKARSGSSLLLNSSSWSSPMKRPSISTKNQPRSSNLIPQIPIHTKNNSLLDTTEDPGTTVISGDRDTRKLVEQFYSTLNGNAGSKVSSALDLAKIGKNLKGSSSEGQPDHIFEIGGIVYRPFDAKISDHDSLIEWLLSIENLTDGLAEKKPSESSSLSPLRDVIRSLTEKLTIEAMSSMKDSVVPETIIEIRSLSKQLDLVLKSLAQTMIYLDADRGPTFQRYSKEIKQSLAKLDDTNAILDVLDAKLSHIKKRISNNKAVMSNDISEKLDVLDYINLRISEHTHVARDKRFLQIMALTIIIILILTLYMRI